MSFVKFREDIFKTKKRGVSKKRSFARLKSAASSTDRRAWSSNPNDQAEYLLDSFKSPTPSTSTENVLYKRLAIAFKNISQKRVKPKNLRFRKARSAENLIPIREKEKLSEELVNAGDTINDLENENHILKKKASKRNLEIERLRNLVQDLNKEIRSLEYFKTENVKLRTDLELDFQKQLSIAHAEINFCKKEIEVYSEIKYKYEKLLRENDLLLNENKILQESLHEISESNKQFQDQVSSLRNELRNWQTRLEVISTASADKEILRSRLKERDAQVKKFSEMIKQQEISIQNMIVEIKRISSAFHEKEQYLAKHLEETSISLINECNHKEIFKQKLNNAEILITQLEALTDQYRATNLALTNTVDHYKNEFNSVFESSKILTNTIKDLQEEVLRQNKELDRLKLFPQSPSVIVHFAQINRVLKSSCDPSIIVHNTRNLVSQIKKEIYGSENAPLPLELIDSSIQTDNESSEISVQCSSHVKNSVCQTEKDTSKYNKVKAKIINLNRKIQKLSNLLNNKSELELKFEKQILETNKNCKLKDKFINFLTESNELLNQTLNSVRAQFKHVNSLLTQALSEVEINKEQNDIYISLYETSLEMINNEYRTYVQVLETNIKYKDEKLDFLLLMDSEHGKNLVSSLEEKLKLEKSNTNELISRISFLESKLKETEEYLYDIEKKYFQTQNVIEELSNYDFNNLNNFYTENQSVEKLILNLVEYKDQLGSKLENNNKILKALKMERKTKFRMRNTIKSNKYFISDLQKRVAYLYLYIKKIKRINTKLVKSHKVSKESILDLQLKGKKLTSENGILKTTNNCLLQEIEILKSKITNYDLALEEHNEIIAEKDTKSKILENGIFKLMKKIEKYKSQKNIKKTSIAHQDTLMNEIDILRSENNSLSNTIFSLRDQVKSLFDRPQKESLTTGVQVSFDYCDKYLEEKLEKEQKFEKEQHQAQYVKNLKLLHDTYERDMTNLKKSNEETVAKLQVLHDQEVMYLKDKYNKEINNMKEIIENNMVKKEELIQLEEKYEIQFEEKSRQHAKEKDSIVKHFTEVLNEKQTQSRELHIKLIKKLATVKCKYELYVKNLKERQKRIAEKISKKHKIILKGEIESLQEKVEKFDKEVQCDNEMADKSCSISPLMFAVDKSVEADIIIPDKNESALVPIKTDENLINVSIIERSNLLIQKIVKLESELNAKHQESAKKGSAYEQLLRIEQMKNKEIARLLETEQKHNIDVHFRLGLHYNRAEQLQLEKDEVLVKLLHTQNQLNDMQNELQKEKEKSLSLKAELKKLNAESKGSIELEMSLNRLKDKIDQAVECEKRLTEELKKGTLEKPTKIEKEEVLHEKRELKLVVVDKCEMMQSWT